MCYGEPALIASAGFDLRPGRVAHRKCKSKSQESGCPTLPCSLRKGGGEEARAALPCQVLPRLYISIVGSPPTRYHASDSGLSWHCAIAICRKTHDCRRRTADGLFPGSGGFLLRVGVFIRGWHHSERIFPSQNRRS